MRDSERPSIGIVALVALALAACGDDDRGPARDGGPDAAEDGGEGSGSADGGMLADGGEGARDADADTDASTDASTDAGTDEDSADAGDAGNEDAGDGSVPAPPTRERRALDGCGEGQWSVLDRAGDAQCVCQPGLRGDDCDQCAPGYEGAECLDCADGYVRSYRLGPDAYLDDLTLERAIPSEELRCVPEVDRSCDDVTCTAPASCVEHGRDAYCACPVGATGPDCSECAPFYQRAVTGGECVLGARCRTALCHGDADCIVQADGSLGCACAGDPTCGGPPLQLATPDGTSSIFAGEELIVEPTGNAGPFTWSAETPLRVLACPSSDPECPPNGVRVVLAAAVDEIEVLRLTATNAASGATTGLELAALPSKYLPMTGEVFLELVPFYRNMQDYLRARGIRGAVLSVSRGGVIVAANGFGFRDAGIDADPYINAGEGGGPLVQPDTPFRIASNSKPFVAAAVRQAASDAGIDITRSDGMHRASQVMSASLGFGLTSLFPPVSYDLADPTNTDPRWAMMSIEHLIDHRAGFWRDVVATSNTGIPAWSEGVLPFTNDEPGGTDDDQPSRQYNPNTQDISYATMWALAADQSYFDPSPNVEQMIRVWAGVRLNYTPGSSGSGGDRYSNLGYILLGRVLEGLHDVQYEPDHPGVPHGWGAYPELLQQYLCEAAGITPLGLFPGNSMTPDAREPYYRDLDADGDETWSWNMADARAIRWNAGLENWQFCQTFPIDGCDEAGAVWNYDRNAPVAYGGVWLAERNSAGGLVATAPTLLRFARGHRVSVGGPGSDSGMPLPAPAAYPQSSGHSGSLPGTRSWVWQLNGGSTLVRMPHPVDAWDDPETPLDLDPDGKVRVDEMLRAAYSCTRPEGLAIAVVINQRHDDRAPASNASELSTSSNGTVYGRIADFMLDAACEVDANGWPELGPPSQLAAAPSCD